MKPEAIQALKMRQQLAKSSTAKLDTLAMRVASDGWLRFNYKYHGAHTARWSGEGVQLQNMPRGILKGEAFDAAVAAIRAGADISEFGSTLEVVASCLRGAFRAPAGKQFVICDLSKIEVRVLGWLANCGSMNEVFRRGGDPYLDFAGRMYKVPVESLKKGGPQYQIAKSAVLGCGYQLGPGFLGIDQNGDDEKTGLWGYAAAMGIEMTQEEAQAAVAAYRQAYPEVVQLWRNLERAAIKAVADSCCLQLGPVKFVGKLGKILSVQLPSGRRLHYVRPNVKQEPGGWPKLTYETIVIGTTWGRRPTYGGHLTENLVQAIARDVLAEGMLRADQAGMTIVGHTHDEIICLEDVTNTDALQQLERHMTEPMPWALDLPLAAEGGTSVTYRK